ncbi:MAG: glycosyl hydrolase family 18 protein, partial [Bacteroidota bacterium]|nr:glycosyl hydrolase family 18 protein [Bacteroidota bacterium]
QSQGIPVLVSIGGQNGHVVLNTIAQKDTFIQGVIDIIEEYGFDGLDIDFEGGSMNFGGGSLTDFSYATISNGNYPKLKNVVDAITEIDAHFGEGFHLTAAPELFYVQVGYGTYTDMAGSFLPVIDNIRNILDYIHVQLYNSGGVVALDNQGYSTGTADFVVAMTDMLLKGFDVATTGIHFNALSQSQVVIGLPACPNAAPAGGYVTPNDLCNALYYLTQGISFGGSYNTQAAVYPNLRGAMTWSVNWDKMSNCGGEWEFSNNIWDFFNPVLTEAETNEILTSDYFVFPNPANDIINIVCPEIKDNTEIRIFDINGKLMMKKKICTSSHKIDLSTFPTGEYFIIIKNSLSKKVFPVIHL